MNTKLIVRLLGYLIALSGVFVYAQEDPRMWDTTGVALRQGDHMEWYQSNAVNERGQTCVTWCDAREGYWDIYAQVIAPDGRRLWPDRGLLINNAQYRQEDPVVVAVDGGWIIAWLDWRFGDRYHFGPPYPHAAIFAQKVSAEGQILWTADGVEIRDFEDGSIFDLSIELTDDRAGGAMIGWREYQYDEGYSFRVQRVSGAGTCAWNEPRIVSNQMSWGYTAQAVSDEDGNMFAVWFADVDSVTRNIFGAKVTLEGTLPWGEGVNGVLIQSVPGMCTSIQICRDEAANGFYAMWSLPGENYWDQYYYAQRFDGNGARLWGDSGVLIYDQDDQVVSLELSPSYDLGIQDGILTAGRTRIQSTYHLIAHKIDMNGDRLWGADGIVVGEMGSTYSYDHTGIQTDYEGGCIVIWNQIIDNTTTGLQTSLLKAARISNTGLPLWGDGGVAVHNGHSQWRYLGLISYIEDSDFLRTLFIDKDCFGFKSISYTDGSQITETSTSILPVIQGEASQPAAITLSDARVAVVWEDNRDCYPSLYYQIVDTLGASRLEPNGRRLLPDEDTLPLPVSGSIELCSDRHGGFFTATIDGDYGDYSLRVTHASGDESPDYVPSYSVVSDSVNSSNQLIAPDGAGGCYVVWEQFDADYLVRTRMLRLNNQCEPLWTTPLDLTEPQYYNDLEQLAATSDGCCVIVLNSSTSIDVRAIAKKINQSGEIVWSVDIIDGYANGFSLACVPDQNNGVYFTWNNSNGDEASGIYLQYLDGNGVERWTHNGIRAHSTDGYNPQILFDEQQGIYLLWSNSGLLAQRLDENGNTLWAPEGVRLSSDASINSSDISATLNGEGGFFCTWNSYMEYHSNLYGIDILPDGTPSSEWWAEGEGNLLAENNRDVSASTLASFGDGSTLAVWQGVIYAEEEYANDQSKPNYHYIIDIYSQRIAVGQDFDAADEIPAATPFSYALNQNYPNPFNPTTTISFSIAKAGTVSLTVYDLLGRSVTTLLNEHLNSGSYQVPWDASSLPSGMYFYRLTAGEFTDVKKTVLLK